jgi:adenine deaminase
MKITNTSRNNTHNFVLNGAAKDGVPPTGHVAPGETADLDINLDVEAAHLQALINASEIAAPDRVVKKIEAKTESAISSG